MSSARPTAGPRLRALVVAPDFSRVVTVGELVALALAVVVAVVGLVSLATAHLGVLTLPLVLGTAALLVVGLGLLAVRGTRPALAWDPLGLLVLGGATALAVWFYLPGFHYGSGDRDPGGYVMHAIAMAREHSYALTDPVLAQGLPVQVSSPGARFAGVWIDDPATGRIVPQFYHLWPALLATSWNLGGWNGIAQTTPLIAVIAVLLAVSLARRVAAGPGVVSGAMSFVAASVIGLVLGTNMLQVWQAKYPTSEILAQLLFTGALLCVVIALQTRWRWPAGAAGALVGIAYLNRADGVLIVLGFVGLGAVLWVLGRFDSRCRWFAGGLGVLLPYGIWQAYGPTELYTTLNLPLTLPLLVGLLAVVVVAALLLRPAWARIGGGVQGWLGEPTVQRRAALGFLVVAYGLFAVGLVRPFLFGPVYATNNSAVAERTYDEITLYRLAWFLTWPGWLLMLGGVAWLALRRRAVAWVVLAPLAVLLPLYAWHAHNSSFFMWWGRRFIPTVLVGIVLAIAVAVGWLATRWLATGAPATGWPDPGPVGQLPGRWGTPFAGVVRRWHRPLRWGALVVAAALLLPILYTGAQQSRPLQPHDEWGGVYPLTSELAALAPGETAVWMWDQGAECCNQAWPRLAPPMWLTWDDLSVLLPSRPEMVPGYVKTYVDHFTDEPVFLVYEATETPPAMPGVALTEVETFSGGLKRWDESSILRPPGPIRVLYDFTVYRAAPSSEPAA